MRISDWSSDVCSSDLELRKAAGRGVRIRLLLDDNGIVGLDNDLAALDALPNVEVRLFNPFILRTLKPLGYAFDFVRLNRRMHTKSDRKNTRLNSSHKCPSHMQSSA